MNKSGCVSSFPGCGRAFVLYYAMLCTVGGAGCRSTSYYGKSGSLYNGHVVAQLSLSECYSIHTSVS